LSNVLAVYSRIAGVISKWCPVILRFMVRS
jgi:hypothetical protein